MKENPFMLHPKLNAVGYERIGTDTIFGFKIYLYKMQCFFTTL